MKDNSHAKYKERPDVRARRIKTLEADKRRQERTIAESQKFLKAWSREGLTEAQARTIANFDHVTVYFKKDQYPASTYEGASSIYSGLTSGLIDVAQAVKICIPFHERVIHGASRWLRHYENRIAYQRAMLGENGGTIADRTKPEKGGACRCWASPRGGWSYIQKVNKVSVSVLDTYGNGGRSFTRTIPFDKLAAVMSAAEVQEKRDTGFLIESAEGIGFFLMQPPLEEPYQEDPEAALRRIWDAKGVSQERQDELLAEVSAKAQPGAKVSRMASVCPPRVKGPTVLEGDFLEVDGLGNHWDRIVMNPPFADGADIKHISHALKHLKPGGRLVAICANGPRQNEKLRPVVDAHGGVWQELPADTFIGTGTSVRTALLSMTTSVI